MIPQVDFMEKVRRTGNLPAFVEDAVVITEETGMKEEEHPNFIESNTSGVTLEELENGCIVPSFGDNQLTISHQHFIHRIEEAARECFPLERFGNTEIRVSHKILGRVPGALNKGRKNCYRKMRRSTIKDGILFPYQEYGPDDERTGSTSLYRRSQESE